jgi:hypothetical protein
MGAGDGVMPGPETELPSALICRSHSTTLEHVKAPLMKWS